MHKDITNYEKLWYWCIAVSCIFVKKRLYESCAFRFQFRNSSSVVERGIAGPKVTGSIPVCSFFFIKLSLFRFNFRYHSRNVRLCWYLLKYSLLLITEMIKIIVYNKLVLKNQNIIKSSFITYYIRSFSMIIDKSSLEER